MYRSNWAIIAFIGLLSVSTLTGCRPSAQSVPHEKSMTTPRWDNKMIDVDGDGDRAQLSGHNSINNPSVNLTAMPPGQGSGNMATGLYAGSVTADRVSDLAHSVDGVDSAHAILTGRTAIIGLDLKRNLKAHQAGPILQEVRHRLLVQAPVFQQVYITADRGKSRQIWNITEGIRQGRPLTAFDRDIRRLQQEIPAIPPVDLPR